MLEFCNTYRSEIQLTIVFTSIMVLWAYIGITFVRARREHKKREYESTIAQEDRRRYRKNMGIDK